MNKHTKLRHTHEGMRLLVLIACISLLADAQCTVQWQLFDSNLFTYTTPSPEIEYLTSPSSADVNSIVTLFGANFGTHHDQLSLYGYVDDVYWSIINSTETTVVYTAPSTAFTDVITVTAGIHTSNNHRITYVAPEEPPCVNTTIYVNETIVLPCTNTTIYVNETIYVNDTMTCINQTVFLNQTEYMPCTCVNETVVIETNNSTCVNETVTIESCPSGYVNLTPGGVAATVLGSVVSGAILAGMVVANMNAEAARLGVRTAIAAASEAQGLINRQPPRIEMTPRTASASNGRSNMYR